MTVYAGCSRPDRAGCGPDAGGRCGREGCRVQQFARHLGQAQAVADAALAHRAHVVLGTRRPRQPSRARIRLGVARLQRDWFTYVGTILGGTKSTSETARKRLRESLLASVPVFKASKFFLNAEMSLADCALAPLIWRLPSLGVNLPREAAVINEYGERIFRNPGFVRSMTDEEKQMRA